MGLFGSIGRAIGGAVKKVGGVVGKVLPIASNLIPGGGVVQTGIRGVTGAIQRLGRPGKTTTIPPVRNAPRAPQPRQQPSFIEPVVRGGAAPAPNLTLSPTVLIVGGFGLVLLVLLIRK